MNQSHITMHRNVTEDTPILYVSESDPQWVIKEESHLSTGGMNSYPYHLACEKADDCCGWVSAWDTRNGVCYHCKGEIPEDVKTLWLLQNSECLQGYMFETQDGEEPPEWQKGSMRQFLRMREIEQRNRRAELIGVGNL